MPGNTNFDTVASTTFNNLQKKMADNISDNIPLFKYLKMKGSIVVSGGDKIVRPMIYKMANAQSYSGRDSLDLTDPGGITAAEYNWKQTIVPVTIDGITKARNAGREKQISILDTLKQQAEISMADKVSEMMFGDGTGNGGKDMLGLQAIVDHAPTTGVLGGIDRATNAFWRNKTKSIGAYGTYLMPYLSTLIRDLTRGTNRPDIIVMNSTDYGYLETLAWGKAQYQNSKLTSLGFEALKYQGIDVIHDANTPTGKNYCLNTKHLKLYINSAANFTMGKFIEPADGDYLAAKYKLYAQLTTDRAESAGVFYGVTT